VVAQHDVAKTAAPEFGIDGANKVELVAPRFPQEWYGGNDGVYDRGTLSDSLQKRSHASACAGLLDSPPTPSRSRDGTA
jgi:hypothetical protein